MKTIKKIEEWGKAVDEPGWFVSAGIVMLSIPTIAGFSSIANHKIDFDGKVTPSVKVKGVDKSGNNSEYHEYITLEGWAK